MNSPSSGALRIVASSGSRFMISALRNGPMRLIEMNSVSTAMVTVTLTTSSANQPVPVCGGFQFQVASENTTKIEVEDTSEYQVSRRESAPAQRRSRDQQHRGAQASGAEREGDAAERDRARLRADDQREAEKGDDRRDGAAPASLSMPISAPMMPVSSG